LLEDVDARDKRGHDEPGLKFEMADSRGVLFVPYNDTLELLSVEDALAVCERVYMMHARGSVVLSNPPSFKLDVADAFKDLGIPVVATDSIEAVVRGADIAVGGTTSGEVVSREQWLKPGSTFISLARRELDPAGWSKLDKVVIDSWEFNMLQREFKRMVEAGLFSRDRLYGEIHELVCGAKRGRERDNERILIHTTGLVSQDVALAHFLYQSALAKGLGIWLPRAQ
jgi:ornithine cyclodeaminase/alanine dehydrogenase-like protein (mu-crystallin family)